MVRKLGRSLVRVFDDTPGVLAELKFVLTWVVGGGASYLLRLISRTQ